MSDIFSRVYNFSRGNDHSRINHMTSSKEEEQDEEVFVRSISNHHLLMPNAGADDDMIDDSSDDDDFNDAFGGGSNKKRRKKDGTGDNEEARNKTCGNATMFMNSDGDCEEGKEDNLKRTYDEIGSSQLRTSSNRSNVSKKQRASYNKMYRKMKKMQGELEKGAKTVFEASTLLAGVQSGETVLIDLSGSNRDKYLKYIKDKIDFDGKHLNNMQLAMKFGHVSILWNTAKEQNSNRAPKNFKNYYTQKLMRYDVTIIPLFVYFYSFSCLFFTSTLGAIEVGVMQSYQKVFEDSLKNGVFNPLNIIKMADSSAVACLNWSGTELLRSVLVQWKGDRSFLASRSTFQKAQLALELAVHNVVPVDLSEGLCVRMFALSRKTNFGFLPFKLKMALLEWISIKRLLLLFLVIQRMKT